MKDYIRGDFRAHQWVNEILEVVRVKLRKEGNSLKSLTEVLLKQIKVKKMSYSQWQ